MAQEFPAWHRMKEAVKRVKIKKTIKTAAEACDGNGGILLLFLRCF